jgi:hypothetical protein
MKRKKHLFKDIQPRTAQALRYLSFCFATMLFMTNCKKTDPEFFGENGQCKNRMQWLQSPEVSTAVQRISQHSLVGAYLHHANGFEWWSDNGELLITVDYQYLENPNCSFPARIKDISILSIVSGDQHLKIELCFDTTLKVRSYRPRFSKRSRCDYHSYFAGADLEFSGHFLDSYPIGSFFEFYRSGSIRSFAYFDQPKACIPPPCLNRVYFFAPDGVLLDSLAESNVGINKLVAEEIAKDLVEMKLDWYPPFLANRFGL